LYSHPGVKEAAVVGMPDTEWGEVVSAVVTLRPGVSVDPSQILAHVSPRITAYKRPRIAEIWDEMPMTASGKISRRDVKRILVERHGGATAAR
ncbi:hypothetical protein ACFWWS_36290, partial [Streptomyces sp. NPDC059083]